MTWPQIRPANIVWKDSKTPLSRDFDDIYALPGKEKAEKQYVFLDGAGLSDLLRKNRKIVIGELGFGTGLNFLLSLKAARDRGRRLDYLAIEGFPLKKKDLERALRQIPGLKKEKDHLISGWPPPVPGFHRLFFDGGRITLTLVFEDAAKALDQLEGVFDAWYLDGFSPDKNPAMWSPKIFRSLVRLSGKQARVATYSAAGSVKRGLEEAGFVVQKRQGFDQKRECLAGIFPSGQAGKAIKLGARIAVVGGGIAGCSAAFALEKKGFQVTLFEKENRLAPGTSGHKLAVFKPKLQKSANPYSRFFLAASLFSLSLYEDLEKEEGGIWHPVRGGVQIAGDKNGEKHLKTLAGVLPGLKDHLRFENSALVFPKAGCLVPEVLCRALTRNTEVVLGQDFKTDPAFEAVVYANGYRAFEAFGKNPFRLTRGQTNYLPDLESGPDPKILSFPGGYLTPPRDGVRILGTSFKAWGDPKDGTWREMRETDLKDNLKALEQALGKLPEEWQKPALRGRVGLRSETIDHLPVVGPAFDEKKYRLVFRQKQKLHHSRRKVADEADIEGLYVLAGFASRGFSAAPFAAEILASLLSGSPLPCPESVFGALSPARFLLKALKQG